MATRIRFQLRRGRASEWRSVNPVLLQGEPGVETDTGKLKIGDGAAAWNALPYATGGDIAGGTGTLAGLTEDPTDPGTFTYESLDGLVQVLDDLDDVDTTTVTPVQGMALVYDEEAGQWTPGTVGETPVMGLVYDGDSWGSGELRTASGSVDPATVAPVVFNATPWSWNVGLGNDLGYVDGAGPTAYIRVNATMDAVLTTMRFMMDTTADRVYRFTVARLKPLRAPVIEAILAQVDATAPYAGSAVSLGVQLPDVSIEAGYEYVLAVTDTTGAQSTAYNIRDYNPTPLGPFVIYDSPDETGGGATNTPELAVDTTLDLGWYGFPMIGITGHFVGTHGVPAPANVTSAYDVWLEEGNTGGRSDFIASLRGETGPVADSTVQAIVHGADPNKPRPANAVSVHWYGSVEPVNAALRDEWIQE